MTGVFEDLDFFLQDIANCSAIKRANITALRKAGFSCVKDLLFLPPYAVVDRCLRETVRSIEAPQVISVVARVVEHYAPPSRHSPYRVAMKDEGGLFYLVFFRAEAAYLRRVLPCGAMRIVSGRVECYEGQYQMPHPDYILPDDELGKLPEKEVVYPASAGLKSQMLAETIQRILACSPELPEWLSPSILCKKNFPRWSDALFTLHNPQSTEDLSSRCAARQRLAYDEFLVHQVLMAQERMRVRQCTKKNERVKQRNLWLKIIEELPWTLTAAQERAIDAIGMDMGAHYRMNRLLQGDVGSGKTVVALAAIVKAVEYGGQAALMVPTEILAFQHWDRLQSYLEKVGITACLLTGGHKGATKRKLLNEIACGVINVVIGTHALFQKDVKFYNLMLTIIDEQHRFGVEQRGALVAKGDHVDVLVMTATPIPRTLLISQFGDMDASILDEKPIGRKETITRLVGMARLEELLAGLQRVIDTGQRVYWVCPLVEESEKLDLIAVNDRYHALQGVFGETAIRMIHGRMSREEKESAIDDFQKGNAAVLVATTVIEVGIDIPEATVIVIEHAERFGLVQLHQLRGRVGRGEEQSSCILLYQEPLKLPAIQRLEILRKSQDGFYIADQDLKLRGPGEILGSKQSGLCRFIFADLVLHEDLVQMARKHANEIIENDPDLGKAQGQKIKLLCALLGKNFFSEGEKLLSL